jgi:hypothetical protein
VALQSSFYSNNQGSNSCPSICSFHRSLAPISLAPGRHVSCSASARPFPIRALTLILYLHPHQRDRLAVCIHGGETRVLRLAFEHWRPKMRAQLRPSNGIKEGEPLNPTLYFCATADTAVSLFSRRLPPLVFAVLKKCSDQSTTDLVRLKTTNGGAHSLHIEVGRRGETLHVGRFGD